MGSKAFFLISCVRYMKRIYNGVRADLPFAFRLPLYGRGRGGEAVVLSDSHCKVTQLFPLNHSNFRIFLLKIFKTK